MDQVGNRQLRYIHGRDEWSRILFAVILKFRISTWLAFRRRLNLENGRRWISFEQAQQWRMRDRSCHYRDRQRKLTHELWQPFFPFNYRCNKWAGPDTAGKLGRGGDTRENLGIPKVHKKTTLESIQPSQPKSTSHRQNPPARLTCCWKSQNRVPFPHT